MTNMVLLFLHFGIILWLEAEGVDGWCIN